MSKFSKEDFNLKRITENIVGVHPLVTEISEIPGTISDNAHTLMGQLSEIKKTIQLLDETLFTKEPVPMEDKETAHVIPSSVDWALKANIRTSEEILKLLHTFVEKIR